MARNQPSLATLNLLQGKLDNPVTLPNSTASVRWSALLQHPVNGGAEETQKEERKYISIAGGKD